MNILLFIFALLFSIWYFTRGQKLLESENEPVFTILNKVFFYGIVIFWVMVFISQS